jgi:hypothetical protein
LVVCAEVSVASRNAAKAAVFAGLGLAAGALCAAGCAFTGAAVLVTAVGAVLVFVLRAGTADGAALGVTAEIGEDMIYLCACLLRILAAGPDIPISAARAETLGHAAEFSLR